MTQFRGRLYERYVSTFKAEAPGSRDAALVAYLGWCRHRMLPLFDGLAPHDPILELGCGPGDLLLFLKQFGFTGARGLDVSDEQIRIARERGLDAEVADVFAYLERLDRPLAAIVAIDFFEHFSKDELMRLLPAIFAALRPGGRLILMTPNGQGLFPHQVIYGDLTHMTIFAPGSMRQLLQFHGFESIEFSESGPVPKDFVGRVRRVLWRLIRFTANAVRRIETGKSQEIWTENLICRCVRPSS